jgi:hypothetical protein
MSKSAPRIKENVLAGPTLATQVTHLVAALKMKE